MQSTNKRLEALERVTHRPGPEGGVFVVDIGTGVTRYWIDGIEVDAATWRACVPPNAPYVVDVGDDA